jgi:hypothetical protein
MRLLSRREVLVALKFLVANWHDGILFVVLHTVGNLLGETTEVPWILPSRKWGVNCWK